MTAPKSGFLAAPAHVVRRPWLVIDAQHGLGNRLRAISSAAVIAEQSGRDLVVLWQPDHHCDCHLSDLLDYPGAVITADPDNSLHAAADLTWSYMEIEEGSTFQAPILADMARHADQTIYIRSAYSLNSPLVTMAAEQAFLKSLRPSAPVLDLLDQVRHPNQVAAHIRMGTGPKFDHLSFEAPENWPAERHRELTEWRTKSHMDRFIPRIDALIAQGDCETLFLAADLPQTYALFAERYKTRLAWLERPDFDRSARQLQYALADMLLLTAADRFLASTWSSFSDMAQRLAPAGRPFERSGHDF
jgi:hypothetical protein